MLINLGIFVIKLIAPNCKLTSLLSQRFYKSIGAISHQCSDNNGQQDVQHQTASAIDSKHSRPRLVLVY